MGIRYPEVGPGLRNLRIGWDYLTGKSVKMNAHWLPACSQEVVKGGSMEKAETLSRRQGVSKNLDKRPKILYDYRVMEESDLFD